VVLDDADLERAAAAILSGAFSSTGQRCLTLSSSESDYLTIYARACRLVRHQGLQGRACRVLLCLLRAAQTLRCDSMRPPKVSRIEDPIADDRWEYITRKGKRRISRLTVGRPAPHPPMRCWYCPVRIEGQTPVIDIVFGSGPVDALMNAMQAVRNFYEMNFEVLSLAKVPRQKTARKATTKRGRARPEIG